MIMDCQDLSPLCVDLDGTLIFEDVMWVSWKNLIKSNPHMALKPFVWLLKGRAYLKHQLATYSFIDPKELTYNDQLLSFLKKCQAHGLRIILATAADQKFAHCIAQHLNIFDEVIASDRTHNRRAEYKAQCLCEKFGEKNFTYIGNSYDDLKVWRVAKHAIGTNLSLKARFFLLFKKQSFFCMI